MNINYKQPQFELFPANSATMDEVNKPKFLLANLTLSTESLVILAILGIMIAVFAFSLGVERGKHLTAQALDERVSAAWNLAPRKPMMAPRAVASGMVQPAVAAPSATRKAMVGNAGFVSTPVIAKVVKPAVIQSQPLAKGRFTLQAATYKNEAFAKQEAMAWKAKGLQSFLIKKGDFWLVCLGQYASVETAGAALKKLPPKYRSSSVRRF